MVSSSPLPKNGPPDFELLIPGAAPNQPRPTYVDGSLEHDFNVSTTHGSSTASSSNVHQGNIEFHGVELLPVLDVPSSQGDSESPDNRRRVDVRSAYPNRLQPWTPFLLRRVSLYGFAAIYVVIIIALTLLQAFDRKNGGLVTTNQNLHYLWTFGPTFGKRFK